LPTFFSTNLPHIKRIHLVAYTTALAVPNLLPTPHASIESDNELYDGFNGALHVDLDEAADSTYLINHDEARTVSGYARSENPAVVATIHPYDFPINQIIHHQKARFSELLREGGELTPPPSENHDTVTVKELWQRDLALRQVIRGICRALDSIITDSSMVKSQS